MFSFLKSVGPTKQANDSFICSLSKSKHQLVYDLYALLTLTDAKGYAMMQFSWMLLRLYGRGTCLYCGFQPKTLINSKQFWSIFQGSSSGNYETETEEARDAFEKRMMEKADVAQKVLSKLSTWMWKCDTPSSDQLENETYIQFNELLQVSYLLTVISLRRVLNVYDLMMHSGLRCQRSGPQSGQHLQRKLFSILQQPRKGLLRKPVLFEIAAMFQRSYLQLRFRWSWLKHLHDDNTGTAIRLDRVQEWSGIRSKVRV